MVKHLWSLLCQESIINKEDNTISINKILESLIVRLDKKKSRKGFIQIPLSYELTTFLDRGKPWNDINLNSKIVIKNPEGKTVNEICNNFMFPKNKSRLRLRQKIFGFLMKEEGVYTHKLSIKEETEKEFKDVAEIPLQIVIEK